MTRKPRWTRTKSSSEVTLYHFPKVIVRVAKQPKGYWSWRLHLGVQDVAMGQAATQKEAEQGGIEKVKKMLKEIEGACP